MCTLWRRLLSVAARMCPHRFVIAPILPPSHVQARLAFGLPKDPSQRRIPVPKAHLTWIDPTTLDDNNTPIPANDFADVEVFMSADGGKNYVNVGHAAPGAQAFDVDLTDAGTFNFKLESKDTQVPSRLGPDSVIVSVTVPPQPLAAIAAPTNVSATLV